MKIFAAGLALLLSPTATLAQQTPKVSDITLQSIQNSIRGDTAAALSALDAGDFYAATEKLRAASANANRLSIQSVANNLSANAPSFTTNDSRFALTRSSTLEFENFLSNSDVFERRFKDNDGRIVTVRVFGEDQDLNDFTFIASDTAMLKKGEIEVAEMRGETALKSRKDDGSLSVIMMSKDDHALIEVEGADEDAVMAFIGELEAAE